MIRQKHCTWMLWVSLWACLAIVPARQSAAVQAGAAPEGRASVAPESWRSLIPAVPVSLEMRGNDLKTLLHILGKEYNLNLLVHEEVKGQVTVSFTDVPLQDVFKALASMANLAIVAAPGSIIEILPASVYEASVKTQVAVSPPPLITRRIDIQYAYDPRKPISSAGKELGLGEEQKDLTELVAILKKRLSGLPGSDINVISRANALLVTDIPAKVEEIVSLLQDIDVPSLMVGIEAKIAEISAQGLEDLGVQWGGVTRLNSGNATLLGGSSGGETGTAPTVPQSGAVGLSGSNFIVNFPAALSAATGGFSLGFILGRQATRVLDVQLSALQSSGKAKLLASPRVTTPNHERALIESGREIPFLAQQIAGGVITTTVQFKKAAIELEVTPHVIGTEFPRTVALDVVVSRKEADFSRSAAVQGNPSLISRVLLTRALVREGETAVIGGLATDDAFQTTSQVPFLGNIPVLGWLFKSRSTREEALQLMIFISPSTLSTPLTGTTAVPALSQR